METLFIIYGRSAVGKTTIARKLQEKYKDEIHEAVSIQPDQRDQEIEGVDYNFVSKEHFLDLTVKDALAERIEYNDNYYGLEFEAFDTSKTNISIVEPVGLKQLKEKMKTFFNIIVIKIEENDDTISQRLVNRGDAPEVREKRINGDKAHFANIEFDYLINSKFDLLDFIIRSNSSLKG